MVVAVKQDGEVGLAYMKSLEIAEKIRKESEKAGEERGRQEGRLEGIVSIARKFGQTDDQIVQLLQEDSHLTREQAKEALAKFEASI